MRRKSYAKSVVAVAMAANGALSGKDRLVGAQLPVG